jgi:molecular chaperone GrpE
MKTKKTKQDTKIVELEEQLHEAQEKEKRSLADYQNLLRRTQQERLRSVQLANQGLMEDLIQPLEHLEMAAGQIDDQGLNMVAGQLKMVLENAGLEEIEVMGKKFNVDFMEAVEKGEKGNKVIKIVRKGYLLNGEVIQHAKVVLD